MTFEPRPTVFCYFQLQVKKLFFWCSTPGGWSHKDGIFHSSSIWGLWFPSEGIGSWHFSSLVLFYTAPFETEDWGWLTPTQALIVSCRFHSSYDRSKLLGIIASSPFAHRGEFPCWEGQAKKSRGCQLPAGPAYRPGVPFYCKRACGSTPASQQNCKDSDQGRGRP